MTREEIETTSQFNKLLNDFGLDTPYKILEIFKESVIFDLDKRTSFKWVILYF